MFCRLDLNMTEYSTELTNNMVSNLVNAISGTNESSFSAYDYLYDTIENNNNTIFSTNSGSQQLATMLQHLYNKMSDNQTTHKSQSNLDLFGSKFSLSYEKFLPSSTTNTNPYWLLSSISFWFVLIVNPIVVISH